MKKLILAIGLMAASLLAAVPANATNCTQLTGGMGLCIPKFNTSGDVWAQAMINAFTQINNSTSSIVTSSTANILGTLYVSTISGNGANITVSSQAYFSKTGNSTYSVILDSGAYSKMGFTAPWFNGTYYGTWAGSAVGSATNLAGGAIRKMPVQTAAGVTAFTADPGNNGYIIGGGTGTITGTSNQVIATQTNGNLVLSTPQNINSGATPTFTATNFSGVSAETGMAAQTQALNMNSHQINNVTDPSGGQDAMTKSYADSHYVGGGGGGGGLTWYSITGSTISDSPNIGLVISGSSPTVTISTYGNWPIGSIIEIDNTSTNTVVVVSSPEYIYSWGTAGALFGGIFSTRTTTTNALLTMPPGTDIQLMFTTANATMTFKWSNNPNLTSLCSGTPTTYSSIGSFSYTQPTGCGHVQVSVVSGGGGGGGNGATGGGGGGGGGYALVNVTLTAGTVVSGTVGDKGTGGAVSADGTAGGTSSFASFVSCTGGALGTGTDSAANAAGGVCTVTGASTITNVTGGTGGHGSFSSFDTGGGGGAGGGGNGADASGNTPGAGGVSTTGNGNGGLGGTNVVAAGVGVAPGGAGAGGGAAGSNAGGNGSIGKVIVTPLP